MSKTEKKFPLPDVAQICILVPNIDKAILFTADSNGSGFANTVTLLKIIANGINITILSSGKKPTIKQANPAPIVKVIPHNEC